MSDFSDSYELILAKQYYEKEKARLEARAMIAPWEDIYNFSFEFSQAFDIDNATGDRQDKLGKILGIPRNVPFVIPKIRFGFSDNPNAKTFGSIYNSSANNYSAPFFSIFENAYNDFELDDSLYQVLLKAKVQNNNGSAFMVSDDYISVQDVVQTIFQGQAYIVDNYDMTLTLYIDNEFSDEIVTIVENLDLIPRGQGVGIEIIRQPL